MSGDEYPLCHIQRITLKTLFLFDMKIANFFFIFNCIKGSRVKKLDFPDTLKYIRLRYE